MNCCDLCKIRDFLGDVAPVKDGPATMQLDPISVQEAHLSEMLSLPPLKHCFQKIQPSFIS